MWFVSFGTEHAIETWHNLSKVGVASRAKMAAGHGGRDGYFVGVDVGTGSVRAGLFTSEGKGVKYSRKEIPKWTNSGFTEGSYEQSTSDIWQAVCFTVRVIYSCAIIIIILLG